MILAILASVVPESPGIGTKIAYGLAIPFFALAAFFSGWAWEFRKWRFDPDTADLWADYRFKSEEHLRHQVIQNRLDCLKANRKELAAKLGRIKRARLWLYLGFAYLVALLLFRLISG